MAEKGYETDGLIQAKIEGANFSLEDQHLPILEQQHITYAIRGINLNKTYSRREFYLSKSKNPKILDNLNINVVKGKM